MDKIIKQVEDAPNRELTETPDFNAELSLRRLALIPRSTRQCLKHEERTILHIEIGSASWESDRDKIAGKLKRCH